VKHFDARSPLDARSYCTHQAASVQSRKELILIQPAAASTPLVAFSGSLMAGLVTPDRMRRCCSFRRVTENNIKLGHLFRLQYQRTAIRESTERTSMSGLYGIG
jgi:hypothetical protein